MKTELDYAEPRSISEACRLLEAGAGRAHAIAGGTDLVVALKNAQKRPELLVDLAALPLHHIAFAPGEGLRIGAMVSLRQLAAHRVIRENFPILAQAALSVGSPQLQAMATVAGNLCQDARCMYFDRSLTARRSLEPCHKLGGEVCHVVCGSQKCWATYAGDLAPALLVLDARLRIANPSGEKIVPLRELFSGRGERPQSFETGELITEILVPDPPPRSAGVYLKLRRRGTLDYPLIGVAALVALDSRGALTARTALALTAVGEAPVLVEVVRLSGQKLTPALIQGLADAARKKAHPLRNVCGVPVRYRLKMVAVSAQAALEQALAAATV